MFERSHYIAMAGVIGVLAVAFALPAGAAASPYLSKKEAKREASEYLDKAIPRWVRDAGATPPVERRYRAIRSPERLARNLVVFNFYASYLDADGWAYDIEAITEAQVRVRETRSGHYFVRGANVEVFESSNE